MFVVPDEGSEEKGREAVSTCPCGEASTTLCADCSRPLCDYHSILRPRANANRTHIELKYCCAPGCGDSFWRTFEDKKKEG